MKYLLLFLPLTAISAELPNVTVETEQDRLIMEWIEPFWRGLPDDSPLVAACNGTNSSGRISNAYGWSGCVLQAPMHLEVTRQITSEEAAAMKEAIGKRPHY